jgi:4-alpha-glucanotransferase
MLERLMQGLVRICSRDRVRTAPTNLDIAISVSCVPNRNAPHWFHILSVAEGRYVPANSCGNQTPKYLLHTGCWRSAWRSARPRQPLDREMMNIRTLDQLARKHGIGLTRPAIEESEVAVSDETKRRLLAALNADPSANLQCYLPAILERGRVWGFSLQLYELRSSRNWGIGDLADLAAFCELAGKLGAEFVGLNPLHAPFLADPDRCSPYEPSSRQFLNPLYIAVDRVEGFVCPARLKARLESLRRSDLVDYAGVAAAKLGVLRQIWRRRKTWSAGSTRALEDFQDRSGEPLWRHALFEALSESMMEKGYGAGWTGWPAEFQDAESEKVARFERDHQSQIEFHVWLQYLAHSQLTAVADGAAKAGLRIGLYLDLAVGEALDGSATWSERDDYVWGASIGSPPDPWAVEGQDWRLAALQPATIAAGRGAPFRKMLEGAMPYAGAIRIDHAAALRRLFLVPFDAPPTEGAYVDYPQSQLLRVLADLSHAHECLVIGEDLGLIPKGLRETLSEANVLSYRIMSYEKDKRGFIPPHRYPALALACLSTHDHQTMSGWWRGKDVEMRARHGLVPKESAKQQHREREQDRADTRRALKSAGIVLPDEEVGRPEFVAALVTGAYHYLAKTPSKLLAVRLADVTDEARPTNVPGTSESYPNWRPKLSVTMEALEDLHLLKSVAAALKAERPRGTD